MNTLSRRNFVKLVVLATGATGCSQIIDDQTQPGLPSALAPPATTDRHPIAHLLNRAAFGPRPGQIAEIEAQGISEWIDQQLDHRSISDDAVNLRLRRFDTLRLGAPDLLGFNGTANRAHVRNELAAMTLLRAVFSERQLYEVLVNFWSDHFSIFHFKFNTSSLKTVDDRDAIRPNALGKFHDLLSASAHSPAMLYYLDNIENKRGSLNENYAREIMELHTLGVDGGYTEDDIFEVAKCFSGWGMTEQGRFTFVPEFHILGEKRVLGETIHSEDGKAEGDRVLEILTAHPSTARYVSSKLVRRFVADEPPPSIVSDCESTWRETNGDIPTIVRTILYHPEFASAPPKLKRPFELVASLLRMTNARYNGSADIIMRLEQMGHRPFGWPTPDGYPDTAAEWSGNLLQRWNVCLDTFTNTIPGIQVDVDALTAATQQDESDDVFTTLAQHFLNGNGNPQEVAQLVDFVRQEDDLPSALGLLAASPAFQWR